MANQLPIPRNRNKTTVWNATGFGIQIKVFFEIGAIVFDGKNHTHLGAAAEAGQTLKPSVVFVKIALREAPVFAI